jgi:hypothetical protein
MYLFRGVYVSESKGICSMLVLTVDETMNNRTKLSTSSTLFLRYFVNVCIFSPRGVLSAVTLEYSNSPLGTLYAYFVGACS